MEELTREEAIRRHRLMWNWLADEREKGNPVTKKMHSNILDGLYMMLYRCVGAASMLKIYGKKTKPTKKNIYAIFVHWTGRMEKTKLLKQIVQPLAFATDANTLAYIGYGAAL